MLKSKVIVTLIILLCMFFLIFEMNENHEYSIISRSFIVPLFAILYFFNVKNRSRFFMVFLVAYSISDLMELIAGNLPLNWDYYIGNSLYIIAYIAIACEIISSMDLKQIFKHFKVHMVILLFLNIYANIVLIKIAMDSFGGDSAISGAQILMETMYNIATLVILSVALINYFYRDDKKAYLLFLGSLCIVVSEVIQIAYYYIPEVEDDNILSISYSILLIVAFLFYHYQAKHEYDEVLLYA